MGTKRKEHERGDRDGRVSLGFRVRHRRSGSDGRKRAQLATMDGKLQQAEQRLRDGDFAAAQELAKAAGPSYDAHLYDLSPSPEHTTLQAMSIMFVSYITASTTPIGAVGPQCVAWSLAFTSAISAAEQGQCHGWSAEMSSVYSGQSYL